MKKVLAIMLSIVMLISMMPATVFAGYNNPAGNNRPADVDWAFIRFYNEGEEQDVDTGDVYAEKAAHNSAVPGATYDAATNTLTIDNYRRPENGLSVNMMGNDFRLNVVGECELASINVWGDGWGGSITVTGDGTLTVNESRLSLWAIRLNAEYVEASFTVDSDVTLNLYGDNGVFYSSMNMFESPDDVVKTVGGRESFELDGAPFYYQNSKYMHAYEIVDNESDNYRGKAAVRQSDPNTYYGVSIWTNSSGEKSYHVSRYIYSQTYDVYMVDTSFSEQYGNDWGEVEFTMDEFESLGFSMNIIGKELSSIFFFDNSSNAHSGPRLINANDPDGIYMLDHNGYSYSDQNDPSTYAFKGTIYKLINGEYGFEADTDFTPVTVGQNDYEALPAGYTPVMENEYEDLYLKGEINEINGNLHVDSQDNEYIVYNNWNNGQSHEYVYAISEVPEMPGCYVATYVEDIEGVENHGYTEVTVPEETGTYEFTTDVTEFSFGGHSGWGEEHIIHFKDATVIDSDTVVFGSGNDAVTLDIINAELDENNDIHTFDGEELYNIEFEISGAFDANTMHIYALALDGYVGEMFVNNGTATFRNPDPYGEDLHFPDEIFISLDDYLMYAIARDSNGNCYLDGETLKMEPGESVFVAYFTHNDNWLHGIFPAVGFNYGVAGEGNFADSLTSMGFTVQEGEAQDFGITAPEAQGVYGCYITVPNNLAVGTVGRVIYSLYELPENFSWDDMWANFSWSETPIVLTNELFVEVVPTWELKLDTAISYPDSYFQNNLADGQTVYIGRNENCFISVDSFFDRNMMHGITPYFVFNDEEVRDEGFRVEHGEAERYGYPAEYGDGIYIEAEDYMRNGQHAELRFALYSVPDGEDPWNYEIDFENEQPEISCSIQLEVRDYNNCIYMVDQDGNIYNDGDTIYFDNDEVKAIAFRTDLRSAENGNYQNYIGWDTNVFENTKFTVVNAGPAFMFDDYRDAFWANDFILIIKAGYYGGYADFGAWLYEDVSENEFDWADTPKSYSVSFDFKIARLEGETGDCEWQFNQWNKTLTISGNGAMDDYSMDEAPWSNLDYRSLVIEDGVTHIGNSAFYANRVKDVDIADSVTSIGDYAFMVSIELNFISLPSNLTSIGTYAFYFTSLHEVEIPASVTTIGYRAFGYYYDEQADDDVTVDGFEIYGYAGTEAETYADDNGFIFHDNTVYLSRDGLWKYCIRPDGAAMLYSDVFQGYSYQGNDTVVTIPSTIDGYTVKELGAFSMSGLTNVTKITVPDSVEIIGFSAFSGDTSLYELELGSNVREIGAQTIDNTNLGSNQQYNRDGGIYINDYLFRVDQNWNGCYRVTDGTKLMALFAFGNCADITRVELPDTITSIGMAMFVGCRSLTEIFIPASVTEINCRFNYYDDQLQREICPLERIYGYYGSYAEQYADENGFEFIGTATSGVTGDCTWSYNDGTRTLVISGNGAMADYGFLPGANEPVAAPWSNFDIEKVVIEDGVTRIGNDAFMGSGIYDADIADSVTSIGTNAFHSCGALDFVTLPPALTEVGAYAFYNTNLREIEIPSTVTTIGQCAFGFYYDGDLDRDMPVDGFEIYGYSNTAAETYANTYGFTFHDNTVYLSRDGMWKYSIRPDGAAMLYSDVFQGYSYQGNDTVVTIPSTIDGYTVKELGAFSMSGLTNVTKITVPDSVESIGFSAFSGCTNLRELVLGSNVTEIGAQVLDNTAIPYKDGAVYCNGYLLRVDQNYEGTFTVKPGTKLMAMFSFGNCNKIERIILPDSINKIDFATFVGCTSLKEILIPHSVGFIYDGAFTDYNEQTGQQERSLERIYGSPNTGAEAFANQNNIPFVNIEDIDNGDINGDGEVTLADYQITRDYLAGNGLTIYGLIAGDVNGDGAVDAFDLFEIDKALTAQLLADYSYELDGDGNALINGYTGTGTSIEIVSAIDGHSVVGVSNDAFKNNKSIVFVSMQDGVKTIGTNAFKSCTALKTVMLPGSLETIGNYAFMSCSALEEVEFASGVTTINYGAFMYCTSLESITLPNTVTKIGTYAFRGCTSLESVTIPASVTSINANSFADCSANLTIYGYAGSYAQTYANANSINFVAIG